MATGGGKYPGPVTFDDNTPNSQFCKIFLTVPGLKAGRTLFGSKEVKNGKIFPKLEQENIHVEISVTGKSGDETYVYAKKLPENINPKESKVEPAKDGQVVIKLRKETDEPWTAHSKHFVLP